jgi:formylglycine-generating enzyme required for sulfatase activity
MTVEIRNAPERTNWAYAGAAIGASWGIGLGLLIVAGTRHLNRSDRPGKGKRTPGAMLSLTVLLTGLFFLVLPLIGLLALNLYSAGLPPDHITLNIDKKVTMKLVRIPAGKFMMGSPESETGRRDDEGPQREVTISKPFYMGVFEVTQSQWHAVMGSHPWQRMPPGSWSSDKPIEPVIWNKADEFCKKLSEKTGMKVRLPTEAQWEYACRSGTTTRYYFGDLGFHVIFSYAWLAVDKDPSTGNREPRHVGQKIPNQWGLYDMYGNVAEWCRDWYQKDYYSLAGDVDPENTTESDKRVHRGGTFGHRSLPNYRSASRDKDGPGGPWRSGLGFRVVVELEQDAD